jgi:hypothetical protein
MRPKRGAGFAVAAKSVTRVTVGFYDYMISYYQFITSDSSCEPWSILVFNEFYTYFSLTWQCKWK